jgi:hypothetical protein
MAMFGPYQLLSAEAQQCGSAVQLSTTWRFLSMNEGSTEITPSTSLFVQLLAGDGQLISQADGPPLRLRPDLLQNTADWIVTDLRQLPASDMKGHSILLGAYDFVSGKRFFGSDDDGSALPDDALVIPVAPCS